MTGLELQQKLNIRGWRIPVIFITGHGTVSLAIAAMKAGAFDFIKNPLREGVGQLTPLAIRAGTAPPDARLPQNRGAATPPH